MVDRETCIKDINKFIKSNQLNDLMILFVYLCELKEIPNIDNVINQMSNNISLMNVLAPNILEELQITLKINKVTDKYNKTILVY